MKRDELLKRAGELGFPVFEPETRYDSRPDPARTLAEVARSGDARLMEGFPVMLAVAAAADEDLPKRLLKSGGELPAMVKLSLAAYRFAGVSPGWADKLLKQFARPVMTLLTDKLESGEEVPVGRAKLRPEKLKSNLLAHYSHRDEPFKAAAAVREEMGLAYAMSQIFTERQKELFLKKLRQERLAKTEAEYFSRVVKKKAQALANEELHRMARRLLE